MATMTVCTLQCLENHNGFNGGCVGKYSGVEGRAKSIGRSIGNLGSNTFLLFVLGQLLMSLAFTFLFCKMVALVMPASVVSLGDKLQ